MIATYMLNLQKFFYENVCPKVSLKRPDRNDASAFELVHPVVCLGWPVSKLSDITAKKYVPGIIIGLREPVSDDGENCRLSIEAILIVYSTGTVNKDKSLTVDDTGFIDLLNFIDTAVRELRNACQIGDGLVLEDASIEAQPLNERYLDFWLGNITFTLTAAAAPRSAWTDLD